MIDKNRAAMPLGIAAGLALILTLGSCNSILGMILQPVADAGPDKDVIVREEVTLDGTASKYAESYLWTFVKPLPAGSTLKDTNIRNSSRDTASFTPDVVGIFTLTLKVTNGAGSASTTVRVTAAAGGGTGTTGLPAPTGLTVINGSATSDGVSLSWASVPGAIGYYVNYYEGLAQPLPDGSQYTGYYSVTTNSMSAAEMKADRPLLPSTHYWFFVQATNGTDYGPASNMVEATTSAATLPTAITATLGQPTVGTIATGETLLYVLTVVPGTTYTLSWDDSYSGTGTYTGDIYMSAFEQDQATFYTGTYADSMTTTIDGIDSGYSAADRLQITVPAAQTSLYLYITPFSAGSFAFTVQ